MATLRAIRRRINSISNIRQVTDAMRMVAAAKLRRAQENIEAAKPYADRLAVLVHHLASRVGGELHPLMTVRPVQMVCLIPITSDRGLCGSFNFNVIRRTISMIDEYEGQGAGVGLICVGKRGADYFRNRGYGVIDEYINIFRRLNVDYAVDVARQIYALYMWGHIDKVEIIYNDFKSAILQETIVEQILPVIPEEPKTRFRFSDYEYEPDQGEILNEILPKYLMTLIWKAMLDSNAAEQAARMTAMENATDNADELIKKLTLQRNRIRQANITREITEIVGTAEALEE